MTEIFNREMTKQKNLEALRRLQELEKKRAPKDTTAIQKKLEERKNEEIDKVEKRFADLLGDSKAPADEREKEKKEEKKNEQKNEQEEAK